MGLWLLMANAHHQQLARDAEHERLVHLAHAPQNKRSWLRLLPTSSRKNKHAA